ncbi:NADPH dehydrogenase 2 [Yarrowia sp. B02]|nr:NADPH dehydrogenase 2 [Yarrowia sp. B02]
MALFKPIDVGSTHLLNRVVMAPLTRLRADPGGVPSKIQVDYYVQRSHTPGTLIISEATYTSPGAGGLETFFGGHIPGIWNEAQTKGWKDVIDAAHAKKCKFYIQLWDIGRAASYPVLEKEGLPFVAPSAITQKKDEELYGDKIRALTEAEIKQKVQDYVKAAENAIKAGADGVEIHSAHGYLPDQFIHWNSNLRTDQYGGSIENRCRFILEIVDAVSKAIGADKVAIRLSPWADVKDMAVDPVKTLETFEYIFRELQKRADEGEKLAFVHLVEPRVNGINTREEHERKEWQRNETFREIWKGPLVRAGGFTRETALEVCEEDPLTLVAFGRYFISTPDLVERLEKDVKFNPYNRDTFYTTGVEGFLDYPFADVKA